MKLCPSCSVNGNYARYEVIKQEIILLPSVWEQTNCLNVQLKDSFQVQIKLPPYPCRETEQKWCLPPAPHCRPSTAGPSPPPPPGWTQGSPQQNHLAGLPAGIRYKETHKEIQSSFQSFFFILNSLKEIKLCFKKIEQSHKLRKARNKKN